MATNTTSDRKPGSADGATNGSSRPDEPATPASRGGGGGAGSRQRKTQVLTKHTASRVRSIADAVVIKDGEPFFICPPSGQVPVGHGHGFGLYHHDTRFVAGYELTIAGIHPNTLAATAVEGNRMELELTMPDVELPDGRSIGKERLAIHWQRQLDGSTATLHDRITIRNYDPDGARLPIHLSFAADFEDIFAIRGLLDERPGAIHDPAWEDGHLEFVYDGADHVTRRAKVSVQPSGTPAGAGVDLTIAVDGRGSASFEVDVALDETVEDGAPPIEGRAGHRHTGRDGQRAAWPVTVSTDSLALNAVLDRSLDDLMTLRSELDGHRYYAAGIPWFSTLFGRDSLIAAYQTLAFDPDIAAETLRLLAARQGTNHDDYRDEEPGKILHELRIGELARLHEIPHTPYYGSIDATPLFLVLLARHADWVGSLDLFHELRPNVERALGWIDATIGASDHGFLAYRSTTDHGLVNQGWKDSGDAIVTADGSIATPPIALAEVQGYVFAAWQGIARLHDRDGDAGRADALRRKAADLQQRFEDAFWLDDLPGYVLALAGDGRPCEVLSSNAGQVLWSGIAARERAVKLGRRLFAPDMFSGWGIRTLSADAVAANPVGYHLGTVWPHDNGLIAEGLQSTGQTVEAERILLGLLAAAADFPEQRLPECFSGFSRDAFGIPVRYPVACHPQAWAAGSMPHLLVSLLGLVPDGFNHRLHIRRPTLPRIAQHVELNGIRVGSGRVDLTFDQADGQAVVAVRRVEGQLDVVEEP